MKANRINFKIFDIFSLITNFISSLFPKNYICVLQHNSEDCAVACLATIIKHYGSNLSWLTIRRAIGTNENGTNLLSLKRGAYKLGFYAESYEITPQTLEDNFYNLTLPAIINWTGNHWVVLHGRTKTHYIIANPAFGLQYVNKTVFNNNCQDCILILEVDENRFDSINNELRQDNQTRLSIFLKKILRYRHILGQVVCINAFLSFFSLSSPFLLQILTDDVLVRGDRQLLISVAMAVGVMYLVSSSLSFIQAFLINHVGIKFQKLLNLQFFWKLMGLPLEYFDTHRSGEIVSRLEDTQQIHSFVSQVVIGLPSQLFIAIISLVLMLYYSYQLTIISIGITILMSISPLILLPKLKRESYSFLKKSDDIQGLMIEKYKGAETLKTLGNYKDRIWENFCQENERLMKFSFSVSKIAIINSNFTTLLSQLGSLILLYFGSNLVINNELTIGMLIAFTTMSGNFTGFIGSLITYLDEYIQVQNCLERVGEINDYPSEFEDNKEMIHISPNADITIRDIVYYYPGNINLFQNFNLTIPGGKSVALIGDSGCGKSTLVKLISGLYFPESGMIKYGPYQNKDIQRECVREQVVLIPQEAHFWSKSIVDNLRLNLNLSFEEIVMACSITNAHQFIEKLPNSYYTVLSEFGTSLSGGQKQRLAIARAILTNPKILILDEATSNLDPVNESNLFEKLFQIREGKTTIIISHNPKIIRRTNHIIYLENGSVKAQGSYKELSTIIGNFIH